MWKKEKGVVIEEPQRQGLLEIKRLVSILNKFPLLEFIPVCGDSVPERISGVRSSEGPRDGYEKIVLAKYVFPGQCGVDVCLGLVADEKPESWHLVETKIEWHERMLGVAGDDPVSITLEASHISMLFSTDELRRKYDLKSLVCENELAEYEYYRGKSAEIIGMVTKDLSKRVGGFGVPLKLTGKFVPIDLARWT